MVYKFFTDLIFVLHFLVGGFLLIGWYFKEVEILYFFILIAWPLSWILLKYCPITKWEFILRHKYDKSVKINDEFIQHYTHRFFHMNLKPKIILTDGLIVFFILSLLFFVRIFFL